MIVYLDSDIIAYMAATRVNKEISWDNDEPALFGDTVEALNVYKALKDEWIATTEKLCGHKATEVIECISDPSKAYFRKDILKTYKGNRGRNPPVALGPLKATIQPQCRFRPKLEADDVMALGALDSQRQGKVAVIVSTDKDMHQVDCILVNPVKPMVWPRHSLPSTGPYHHMMQTLGGDRVDNYFGCPGIGPVKAVKILAGTPRKDWWHAVVSTYASKGLTEQDALVQAQVAWIVTQEDETYPPEDNRRYLWNPDKLKELE